MMEHLNMQSMDKVAANVAKIRELFPNCVTERINNEGNLEHAIDFDMLKQELSDHVVDGLQERYQFTWPDKRKAILAANTPINKTLRPCREESVDFDNTENLYIEGDNLEVLKVLQETYLGKVKMIYIDPPYNTGNDFVYEDDFKQSADEYIDNSGQLDEEGNRLVANTESNGRFHTDWLNMIYPRLKLAKDLLSEDGVIFISIDDNEVDNLRKICDEVFGEENFKSNSIIINNRGGRDYGGIALQHDYILIYSKNIIATLNPINETDKQFQYYDEYGGFNLMELRNRNIKFNDKNRPNLCYPFYVNPNNADKNGLLELSLEPKIGFIEVYPAKSNGVQTVWRWGKEEKARDNINKEIFGKENRNGGYMIVQKYRKSTKMQRSVWDEKEFVNERGTEAIKDLLDKAYFNYPKSVYTIKRVLELGSSKNSLILDFFSGSATTAHAVMQLNAEDGGKRKFIMVQLPEVCAENSEAYKAGYKNICEIGKERIRRAGQKIKEENPLTTQDLDIGFRVLKCDSSNMEDVYFTPKEYMDKQQSLFIDNIKKDRSDEDLLFDAMLKLDTPLSSKIEKITIAGKTVYNVAQGHLMACFDKNVTDEVITAIAKEMPSYFVMRDSSQADDSVAINFEQIFNTYSPQTVRRVL